MVVFFLYLGVYGDNAGRTKKNLSTMFLVPTIKGKAKANMNPFYFQGEGGDCEECDPLNDGTGGDGGYPK